MNGATLASIAFYGSIEAEPCCGMFAESMVGSIRDRREIALPRLTITSARKDSQRQGKQT
jgi:hypothetical protein